MIIQREVFQNFYYYLLYKFRERLDKEEWLNGFGNQHKDESKEWWFIQRNIGDRQRYVSLEITASAQILDNWIFYRIYTKYGIDKIKTTELSWSSLELRALGAALKYLKFVVPPEITINTKDLSKKEVEILEAKILFQVFLEAENPKALKVYPHLIIFDFKYQLLKDQPLQQIEPDYNKDRILTEIEYKVRFINLIRNYFRYLNANNFEGAMNCWHPDCQLFIWNNNSKNFSKQHYYIKHLSLTDVFGINIFEQQVNLHIYYHTFFQTFGSVDLKKILTFKSQRGSATSDFDKYDEFSRIIKSFISKLSKLGLRIEEENFWSLGNFKLIEKIHEKFADDPKSLKSVFPDPCHVELYRFASLKFILDEDGNFCIKEFTDLATTSIEMTLI